MIRVDIHFKKETKHQCLIAVTKAFDSLHEDFDTQKVIVKENPFMLCFGFPERFNFEIGRFVTLLKNSKTAAKINLSFV